MRRKYTGCLWGVMFSIIKKSCFLSFRAGVRADCMLNEIWVKLGSQRLSLFSFRPSFPVPPKVLSSFRCQVQCQAQRHTVFIPIPPPRVDSSKGPPRKNRQNFDNFWIFSVHGKNGLRWPQIGPGGFFSY